MIFKYGSSEFEKLRDKLLIFFEKQLDSQNLDQPKKDSINIIYRILKKENIDNLHELDILNLSFSNWYYNENRNTSIIANQNYLLLEFYESDGSTNIDLDAFIDAIFLVFYADFYEASLICKNQVFRPIFRNNVANFNKNLSFLSKDSFEILTSLWFIVPQRVFTIHLDQHLDPQVLKTVKSLQENEVFLKNKTIESEKLLSDINEIRNDLIEQRSEYNFVRLSKGFSKLRETKEVELKTEKKTYDNLMRVVIAIVFIKTIGSLIYLGFNESINSMFIAITITTVFFLFILLYFFRISLVNIKSIKSQILQIDLRLTLCQFIHNYGSDTKGLREGIEGSFNKFESVIFAPLVATEDQMPATFDGLEQLTGMIGLFNKKSD